MYAYKQDLIEIRQMLAVFVKTKFIETKQLSKMDPLISKSEEDQFRTLSYSFSLDVQRTIFGAVRNINMTVKCMKEKLKNASAKHENPTTAEKALEIMETLNNLVFCLNAYESGYMESSLSEIDEYSRILYRKAKAFGFSESLETQLREAGITNSQIESFIGSFDSNLAQELDIEEEVQSNSESSS
jgi:hypothetical protein